jgi:1-phosphofructokinase family hexose kinase
VRLSDFKTNEYASLIGGAGFEPKEDNPMLGFRGASRYAHPAYAEGFALECAALARVRGEMGLTNLKIMVPFCRRAVEAEQVIAVMAQHGLKRVENGLEIFVVCEIPNNVIAIDAFAQLFDGFSIGSNDLTQLTLGVDRDSEIVAFDFDERDPGMLEMLRLAVTGAKRNHRHVGICGEAPVNYPEIARFLAGLGIDSISVNAASRLRTLTVVHEAGAGGRKPAARRPIALARSAAMAATVTLTMNPALDIATATERVEPVHKLRCTAPRYDAGGGINAARAVHALGGEALAIFPAGGAAGEMIRYLLDEEGVNYRAVAIAGFTRESLAVEERRSGNQYRFILPGPEIGPADQERCLDQLSAAAPQADYIVASGSLPLGVPDDFNARVAALAKRHGKRLVLDTSGAALKQAGQGIYLGIYLLKPSLRELEELVGREVHGARDEEAASQEVIAQGRAEIVVLSLGACGALLVSQEGRARVPAIPVEARSTVGAGDSMLAGILVGLTRGLQLAEAVHFGMAAGAAALLGSGTQLCRLPDVERLSAQLSSTS